MKRRGKYPRYLCILVAGFYKAGDLPPGGYVERQEWASVQAKAGLRQRECPNCPKWLFPQETKTHNCTQGVLV